MIRLHPRSRRVQVISPVFTWLGVLMPALITASCGGGTVPESLRDPRVEVSEWTPSKDLVFQKEGFGLVKAVLPLNDEAGILVFGGDQFCRASFSQSEHQCVELTVRLSDLDWVPNALGEPSAIVGSGLWGAPSAASINMDGSLNWRYDGGYGAMGRARYVDEGENRLVVFGDERNPLLFLDFATGDTVRQSDPARVIASADFTGDGRLDVLLGAGETDFVLVDGGGTELAELSVSTDYWYEPVLTSAGGLFLVLSAGNILDVHDSQLGHVRRFDALAADSPLHVVAATFGGTGPDAPFAALFKGRGGWHRSILYLFAANGDLVYKEILGGDFQSIYPIEESEGTTFLVGGRSEVWKYSFPS